MLDNCKSCGIKRDEDTFYVDRWSNICKKCTRKANNERRKNNQEKYLEREKLLRLSQDKDKIKKYQENYRKENSEKAKKYGIEWREENKDKVREDKRVYVNNRRDSDPLYKLRGNIRSLIKNTFLNTNSKKPKKTEEILGCTLEFFIEYLSAQFIEEMSLNNHGSCKEDNCTRYWELDHIYPVSKAISEEHLMQLNHYTNFRPLWKDDNRTKLNKIEEVQLRLL